MTGVNMQITSSVTKRTRITWSITEIAEAMGVSENFLRYEVKRGNLLTRKFGRRVLVKDDDLRQYLENGSKGGADKKVRDDVVKA